MTTPSTATFIKNYVYEHHTSGSVVSTQVNNEQPSQWVWYPVTDGHLAPLGAEYGYRYDAAYLQFIQTLLLSRQEEDAQQIEYYFAGDEPPVYFPPIDVAVFEMEVTETYNGRLEATFTLDDLEYLIDD